MIALTLMSACNFLESHGGEEWWPLTLMDSAINVSMPSSSPIELYLENLSSIYTENS